MTKFEIFVQKDGDYRFHLRAENGRIIITSEGYTTLKACRDGIEAVKKNAEDLSRYDLIESSSDNNKWYFNLRARNGEIIGTSEIYNSFENVRHGASLVEKFAATAPVVELIPA